MFLQKIDRLASDWCINKTEIESVARESLLYGMRLVRHPSALKRELRKLRISSLIAKPLWSGNAYLLHVLPDVLCDPKKKIPCLDDYHFARRILTRAHLREIKKRRKNLCKITPELLFKDLLPKIKSQAWRGRFIPQFDRMNENLKDIEQDLAVRALEVVNKEVTNFKTQDKDKIKNYLEYCVTKKADTYLGERTPRQIRARIEPEAFDRVVHQARQEEHGDTDFSEVEFKNDLKSVLSVKVYRGVALLMNFAEAKDAGRFDRYLHERNIKLKWLTQTQLKLHIEKFLGAPVFEKVTDNLDLKQFLLGRIKGQRGVEDVPNGGYARCDGI
jgi:hypothetical protein